MKFSGFYLIAFFLFSFQAQKHNKEENRDEVTKILVSQIPFNISSVIDIDCNKLDRFSEVDTFDMTSFKKRIMNDFSLRRTQSHVVGIDARARILFFHNSGRIDTVCLCNTPAMTIDREIFLLNRENDIYYLLDSMYGSRHNIHVK